MFCSVPIITFFPQIHVQAQKRNFNGSLTVFQIVVYCRKKIEGSKNNKRGINMASL
jgi:hypothetical protein